MRSTFDNLASKLKANRKTRSSRGDLARLKAITAFNEPDQPIDTLTLYERELVRIETHVKAVLLDLARNPDQKGVCISYKGTTICVDTEEIQVPEDVAPFLYDDVCADLVVRGGLNEAEYAVGAFGEATTFVW